MIEALPCAVANAISAGFEQIHSECAICIESFRRRELRADTCCVLHIIAVAPDSSVGGTCTRPP